MHFELSEKLDEADHTAKQLNAVIIAARELSTTQCEETIRHLLSVAEKLSFEHLDKLNEIREIKLII